MNFAKFPLGLLLTALLPIASVRGQSTAFTYQGRLDNLGVPANGLYDFRFRLDADVQGNTILASFFTNAVPVNNGIFTVMPDYGGGFFNGSNYWLEIGVKTNNDLNYATLNPLQPFTPAPYSLYALTASNVTGIVNVSQVNGTLNAGQLPANVVYSTSQGVNLSGSFAGDGSGLTNFATGNFVFARNHNRQDFVTTGKTNVLFSTIAGSLAMIQGWTTDGAGNFYCNTGGKYLVQYSISAVSSNTPARISTVVSVNGVSISGSGSTGISASSTYPSELSGFGIVSVVSGDDVSLQYEGDTGVTLPSSPGSCNASLIITPLPIVGQ